MEPGQAIGFGVAKFASFQVKAAAGIFHGFAKRAIAKLRAQAMTNPVRVRRFFQHQWPVAIRLAIVNIWVSRPAQRVGVDGAALLHHETIGGQCLKAAIVNPRGDGALSPRGQKLLER